MTSNEEKHLEPSEAGVAALFACLVQTLAETDSSFQSRFEKNLEQMYYKVRESKMFAIAGLETLKLVGDLLKQ